MGGIQSPHGVDGRLEERMYKRMARHPVAIVSSVMFVLAVACGFGLRAHAYGFALFMGIGVALHLLVILVYIGRGSPPLDLDDAGDYSKITNDSMAETKRRCPHRAASIDARFPPACRIRNRYHFR